MTTGPALPLRPEPLPLASLSDPVLVDPGPRLLRALVAAYREAAPALVAPSVDELAGGEGDGGRPARLPRVTVLAGEAAAEAATAGFRSASRLAALTDAGVVDLRALDAPQPNAALVADETGFALVDRAPTEGGDGDPADGWYRVGDDPSLRERYASVVAGAEPRRVRTPSRRRAFEGVASRCDASVAAAVLRALDASPPGASGDGDGPGPEAARIRAYAVGAREGVSDRDLRRALEDAGLGSPATFTRIKRLLREADLIETTTEPQPVGRPRQRLAARGALAAASGPAEVVAAVRGVGD